MRSGQYATRHLPPPFSSAFSTCTHVRGYTVLRMMMVWSSFRCGLILANRSSSARSLGLRYSSTGVPTATMMYLARPRSSAFDENDSRLFLSARSSSGSDSYSMKGIVPPFTWFITSVLRS